MLTAPTCGVDMGTTLEQISEYLNQRTYNIESMKTEVLSLQDLVLRSILIKMVSINLGMVILLEEEGRFF